MRLVDDIAAAARFGASTAGGITRLAWSKELMEAHDWLKERFSDAGLAIAEDGAGNVFGRWETGSGRAILLGSHLDTVPNGGRFDGALGVLGGLTAIELLRDKGAELQRPVWVSSFMDEEGARFGASMIGSRAFVGDNLEEFLERRDTSGCSLRDAMASLGFHPAGLAQARGIDQICAYLELHIEQGPVLERLGVDVGIVTAITGLLAIRVQLVGEANHAGTTPMGLRHDALAGAARIILALRDEVRRLGTGTGTVGTIVVEPGAPNVIPGRCYFSIDFRVPDEDLFEELEGIARELVTTIASDEQLEASLETLERDPPVALDERVVAYLEKAAEHEGAKSIRLPSGAGHDAMVLAPLVPTGMLFVPSENGVSHSPKEYTRPEYCELGAKILARATPWIAADDSIQ